jgi:hypothetical protein
MFDELDELGSIDLSEIKNVDTATTSYGGSDNKKSGNWGGGFQRKEDKVDDPYIPVVIFVDREFPPEVKTSLYNIASKLINKKITVRYNGDDKDFHEKLSALSDKFTECYIPWKGFNEIESKHYFNMLTAKDIAQRNFAGWDKLPKGVQSMMARNVRMIFGDKNSSIALCVITWSKDGASRASEVTKDTGRSSFVIKTASTYGWPVVNIAKENAGNLLEKTFGL